MNKVQALPKRIARQRRTGLLLGSILASGIAMPALAQSAPPDAPPIRIPTDQNGVDLATGNITAATPEITIGAAGQEQMKFSLQLINSINWKHAYYSYAYVSGSIADVYIGAVKRTFTKSGSVYVSDQRDGSTFVANGGSYTYTTRDGTIITYAFPAGGNQPWAISETRASGEKLNFHYKSENYCYYDGILGGTICFPVTRPQSVTSSLGYQVKFAYESNSASNYLGFTRIASVKLINNAVEYCDPAADSCSGLTQSWPTLSFSTVVSGGTVLSVTNALSQVTQYSFDGNMRLSGIKRPSSSSNDVTIGYHGDGRVSSVAIPGRTTSYNWSLAGATLTGVAKIGSETIRTTTADTAKRVVLTDKDGLNRTTSYTYDSYGRPTHQTSPEGDKTQVTYDVRGNATEIRRISKTPGTPADIVETAGYDATCSSPAKCNKPNWTKDALLNQTDYTYNTTTGQLLTVTAPAPVAGGIRPKTTYTYANKYARIKNASGALVQASTSVSKLATASTCLTGATCANTADEQKATITYQAGSSSVPSNILPISVNVKAGNNSVSSTTAMAYDKVANLISVDGPLSGTGDTTAYKFDALRRQVGTIGPDPDGTGSLPNMATRITYDSKGRTTKTEEGTTAGQTDSAWSGFSPAAKVEKTFDNADRVLTERLKHGSTTYGLTQHSYDSRGRLDCTAVRMNTAEFGSPPASACTLDTAGSDGKDRITKYTYNVADEVTQVRSAYGTTALATESFSYTSNGKLSYVVDGNSNRTTYEYDGHDRLSKTRYPVATKGQNQSSTTDYEQLTYDAASNVTSVRLRDGTNVTMTFDKLNRLKSRAASGESTAYFSYNLLGMPTLIDKSSYDVSYTYDALGRMTSEGQAYGSASYQYDAAGNPTRLTWSDGFYVAYDYDKAYRITKIRENGVTTGIGVLATYAYDNLGRRSTVTYGNGTSRTYVSDSVDRLTGLKIDLASTGNDLTIGRVGTTGTALAYNPASQIKSLTKSNDAYAYMSRYNVNRSYTTNGLNQYTAAGGVSFSYDARGNLTSSGSNSYTYSKFNELKSGPGVTSMVYDGTGRLVSYTAGSSTRFGYAGSMLIDERNTSNTILRRYVHGPGVDEPIVWYEGSGTTDRRWLQADERGSIIAVSDASGNLVGINSYDEFGIPAPTNIGRFQYTGQTWIAELGMYNYKARFYSPTLGRFMQTDPIGYADGINWYNYAGGDPVNGKDPSGLACEAIGCGDGSGAPNTGGILVDAGSILGGSLGGVGVGGGYNMGLGVQRRPTEGGGGGGGRPILPTPREPQEPQKTQCGRGGQAERLSTAIEYSGRAHDLFGALAEAGGGEAGKRAFAPLNYALNAVGAISTFTSSLQRGESVDVAYMRTTSPLVSGLLGGVGGGLAGAAAGGAAGSVVPILGNGVGAIGGGIAGGIAGSIVGEKLGEQSAEEYAKARGYGGC